MSHDQGLPWARHHSSRSNERPSLERPSLFAGMSSDEDDAPERVRILSTLAANRPPSKRASHRRSRTRRSGRSSWQFKTLLGLMGLGIVGLLGGFAMVLMQGHPASRAQETREPAGRALAAAHSPASVAVTRSLASSASSATPEQSAVIEDMVPSASAPIPNPASTDAKPALAASTAPQLATVAQVTPTVAPAASATESRRSDKPSGKAARAEARPRSPTTPRGQDADVALLEAMFTHTRAPRTAADTQRLCAQQPQAKGCPAPR